MAGNVTKTPESTQGGSDQFACGVCGTVVDSVLSFLHHKTTHVDRGVARGCEICQLAFSRQAALFEHYRRKHSISFESILNPEPITVKRAKKKVNRYAYVQKNVPANKIATPKTTKTTVKLPNGFKLNVMVEDHDVDESVAPNRSKHLPENIQISETEVILNDSENMTVDSNATALENNVNRYLNDNGKPDHSKAVAESFLPRTSLQTPTKVDSVPQFIATPVSISSLSSLGSSKLVLSNSSITSKISSQSASNICSVASINSSSVLCSLPYSTSVPVTIQPTCPSSVSIPINTCSSNLATSSNFNPSSSIPVPNTSDQLKVTSIIDIIEQDQNFLDNGKPSETGYSKVNAKAKRKKIKVIDTGKNNPKYIVIKGSKRDNEDDMARQLSNKKGIVESISNAKESNSLLGEDDRESSNWKIHQTETIAQSLKIVAMSESDIVLESDTVSESFLDDDDDDDNLINDQPDQESGTVENASALLKRPAYLRQRYGSYASSLNLNKKTKLTPVIGLIPLELNMSDFYFVHIVSKSGANSLNMNAGRDQFKCLFCSEVAKWRGKMCRHMREVHKDKLDSGVALDASFQHKETKDGNIMKMTDYIKIEMAKNPKKRKRGVESQDLPGEYPCEQCGKIFNRLRYLRMHLQQHRLKNDYLCSMCSKTFKTKNNLNQHLKTHEERGPYKCPECDFESAVNIAIHRHRQIHSGNSLICDICGKAYSDKSTLTKHKRVHDPSRPFGCVIPGCTLRFRTQVMRNAHIQGHGHKRAFKCNLCDYAFRHRHHLQRHEKVVHNIVHEPRPSYENYYRKVNDDFNENQYEMVPEEENEIEVSQEVNLIINDGNMSNVITTDNFDLESALQSGQLVIAADNAQMNYEMADISNNVVYQTFLPDSEVQQYDTQSATIPPLSTGQIMYEGVEAIQSEVEIEHS